MFTGIVEETGEVADVRGTGANREVIVRAGITGELRIDQSVSHNGVCLTVVELMGDRYRVTAVEETLRRSNLGDLKPGDMVQGHVDTVTACLSVEDRDGSWCFTFALPEQKHLLVEKGSICLNGVSLTIARLTDRDFSVAIIPYTFEHTTFSTLRAGQRVNVEFDVLGKYVERMMAGR